MDMSNYLISNRVIYKVIETGEGLEYKRILDINLFLRRAIMPLIIIGLILVLTGMWWSWADDYMEWAFRVAEEANIGY